MSKVFLVFCGVLGLSVFAQSLCAQFDFTLGKDASDTSVLEELRPWWRTIGYTQLSYTHRRQTWNADAITLGSASLNPESDVADSFTTNFSTLTFGVLPIWGIGGGATLSVGRGKEEENALAGTGIEFGGFFSYSAVFNRKQRPLWNPELGVEGGFEVRASNWEFEGDRRKYTFREFTFRPFAKAFMTYLYRADVLIRPYAGLMLDLEEERRMEGSVFGFDVTADYGNKTLVGTTIGVDAIVERWVVGFQAKLLVETSVAISVGYTW